jgi:hypothetical protein
LDFPRLVKRVTHDTLSGQETFLGAGRAETAGSIALIPLKAGQVLGPAADCAIAV